MASDRRCARREDGRWWLIVTRSGAVADVARDAAHADDMRAGDWDVVEVVPSSDLDRARAEGREEGRREAIAAIELRQSVSSSMVEIAALQGVVEHLARSFTEAPEREGT